MRWKAASVLAMTVLFGACASAPIGPSVIVLPGDGKTLDAFQADDVACRQWAGQQVPAGSDNAWMMQRRYDIAYQQCMYTRGNNLPGLSRSSDAPPPPPGPVPGQRVPRPPPGAVTPPRDAPPPPPPPPR